MSGDDDCEDGHCNWRPFDFNFEPQYLWSNLAFYSANLLSLIVLFVFSHRIKAHDFIKSYLIMSIYSPACLMIFAILFTINRLADIIYVHSLVMDTVCKIFNGLAKTTFLISSGAVLILAIYVAIKRRPIGLGVVWAPFCCSLVFAIIWLFFFANRLHLYFLIADGCLLLLAFCIFLCCSDFRFGSPVDPMLSDARSRLFWTSCFVSIFLAFYAYVEIFYPPGGGSNIVLNQLRGLQYVFLMMAALLLLPPYRDILFCKKEPLRPENDPSYMRNTESSPLPPTPPSAPPLDPPSYPSINSTVYNTYPLPQPQPYPVMVHQSSLFRITTGPTIHYPGVVLHPSSSYPQVHQPYFYVHG